jgi:hypothetical protein
MLEMSKPSEKIANQPITISRILNELTFCRSSTSAMSTTGLPDSALVTVMYPSQGASASCGRVDYFPPFSPSGLGGYDGGRKKA